MPADWIFVTKRTHPVLWKWPHELSPIETLTGFFIKREKYQQFRRQANSMRHLTDTERDAWAAHAAKTHPGFHSDAIPKMPYEQKRAQQHFHLSIANAVLLAIVAILLLFLLARPTKAEPNLHLRYSRNELAATFGMGDPQITPIYPFQFDGSNFLKVNCITGCSASSGFTDNSTYTVGTSAINVIGAYFTSGADPACTTGNACRLRADASSNLRVNCVVGCSASAGFADNSAFTAGTTPISITGGWFATSPTACTTGNACAPSMTSDRKMFVQAFQGTSPWVVSASGNFGVTQQTSPWVDNITQWNSVALGSPSAYGTSPGAVNVPGVNAFITNAPTVTANAGTNLNTSALQLDVTGQASLVAGGGTTAPSKLQMVGGKTNDGTAQYDIIPEGAGGRSLIIEGFAGGTKVPVDGSGVTQPVSGTVTANAGTNLNTSALMLDASKCSGATGLAVPANGCLDAGNGSGNLTARLQCDGYQFYDASTNGATQLVALVSGKTIYVCGYSFTSSSSTANTLKLVYGTGSNCATGQTAMTPGYVLQAATSTGPIGKVIPPTGLVNGLKTAASNALCVLTNAAQAAQAEVWYTQF